MNDRKYIKLNTSIQTGSNAGQIPEESDGTIPATIQLRLPNNIFSSQDGAQKVDDVSMLTTKFRISMKETPIIQIPMDEELSQYYQEKISKCKLDVYPFSILQDNVIKPNTPGENIAFPKYKNHLNQFLFRFYNNPEQGVIDSSYYFSACNAVDFTWFPNNNAGDTIKFEIAKKLNLLDDQILNLTVPTHHENVNISDGNVYLKKLATIQQMLADGMQTAMTYASSDVLNTYIIDFIRSDYADDVTPTVDKTISYEYQISDDTSFIYYFWKHSSNNVSAPDLDFAIKPLVKITENSFSISYDSGSFKNNVPIVWNPAYVNTFDTPIQMTLNDLVTAETYQPPPKRVYKYGVNTSGANMDSLSYEFSLIQPEICTVFNVIGNRTMRDTFPFLEWSPMKVVNPPQNSILPVYQYSKYTNAYGQTTEYKYNYFCNKDTVALDPDSAIISVSQYSVGDITSPAYGLYYAGYNNAPTPALNQIPDLVQTTIVPMKDDLGVFICVHFYYVPEEGVRPLLSSYKTNGLVCITANTSSFTNTMEDLIARFYVANMSTETTNTGVPRTEYLEYDVTLDPNKYSIGTTTTPYTVQAKDFRDHEQQENITAIKAFYPYYSEYCNPLEDAGYSYSNADEHYVMGREIPGFNNWLYQAGPSSFPEFYSGCIHQCLPPWREDIIVTSDEIQIIDGRECHECVCAWYLHKRSTTNPVWTNSSILFANPLGADTPTNKRLVHRSYNRTTIFYSGGTLTTSFENKGEISLAYPNILESRDETFYFLDGSSTSVNIGSPEVIEPEVSGVVYHVDDHITTTNKSFSVNDQHKYSPINPYSYEITTDPDTGEITSVSSSPTESDYTYALTYAKDRELLSQTFPHAFIPFNNYDFSDFHYFIYHFKIERTYGQPYDVTDESTHLDQYLIVPVSPIDMTRQVVRNLTVVETPGIQTETSSSTTYTNNRYDSTDPNMAQYISNPSIVSNTTEYSDFQYSNNHLNPSDEWFDNANFKDLIMFDEDAENGVYIGDYAFSWFQHPIATYPGNYDSLTKTYFRIGKPLEYDPEYKYADIVESTETYVVYEQYIFVQVRAHNSGEQTAFSLGAPYVKISLTDHASLISPYTYSSSNEILTRSATSSNVIDYRSSCRLTFTWNDLATVIMSPIQSFVLVLNGIQCTEEIQPINISQPAGSSLVSTIPIIENYYSLASTIRDLHDELVVVRDDFNDSAVYKMNTSAGQERSITLSAKYITKDGRLHQMYIPKNGVFSLQLTFGISYYIA